MMKKISLLFFLIVGSFVVAIGQTLPTPNPDNVAPFRPRSEASCPYPNPNNNLDALSENEQLLWNVRWNDAAARYEVFANPKVLDRGDHPTGNFIWGPSQITVAIPCTAKPTDDEITAITNNTNPNMGVWTQSDVAPNVPATDVTWDSKCYDFHAFAADFVRNGGIPAGEWKAGEERLIFAFTLPGVTTCVAGLRMYQDCLDPDSTVPSMQGSDYWNTINNGIQADNGSLFDAFLGTYGDIYTKCPTNCDAIVAPELTKQP